MEPAFGRARGAHGARDTGGWGARPRHDVHARRHCICRRSGSSPVCDRAVAGVAPASTRSSSVPTSQKMIAEQASVYLGRSAAGQCSHGKRPWGHPAAVVCHGHGTTLRGFLPRGWDHPVASNGTISLATSPAGSPRWPNTFACPRSATKALAVTSTSMNSGAPSGTGVPRYLGAILQALTMRTHGRAYAYANRTHGHRHECVLQP